MVAVSGHHEGKDYHLLRGYEVAVFDERGYVGARSARSQDAGLVHLGQRLSRLFGGEAGSQCRDRGQRLSAASPHGEPKDPQSLSFLQS